MTSFFKEVFQIRGLLPKISNMNANSLSHIILDNFEISSKVPETNVFLDVISPFATKNIQNARMIVREYDLAQVEEAV